MKLTGEGIRRNKKVVLVENEVDDFLKKVHVGYLGLVDGDEPYVIPLNFVWHNDAIYFHGAAEGRKARLMQNPAKATFTVAEEMGIVAATVPGNTGTAYMSAMIFGMVERVSDLEEATSAMSAMLDKYVPGYFPKPLHKGHVKNYVSGSGSHTSVYRLSASKVTSKKDMANGKELFYHGRTQQMDLEKMLEERKKGQEA